MKTLPRYLADALPAPTDLERLFSVDDDRPDIEDRHRRSNPDYSRCGEKMLTLHDSHPERSVFGLCPDKSPEVFGGSWLGEDPVPEHIEACTEP